MLAIRRRRGKNDDLDAQNAVHAAFASQRTVTPRRREGLSSAARTAEAHLPCHTATSDASTTHTAVSALRHIQTDELLLHGCAPSRLPGSPAPPTLAW
jgi:hypothetical protein